MSKFLKATVLGLTLGFAGAGAADALTWAFPGEALRWHDHSDGDGLRVRAVYGTLEVTGWSLDQEQASDEELIEADLEEDTPDGIDECDPCGSDVDDPIEEEHDGIEEPVTITDSVAEPATWGLMIIGFAALAGAVRRRQLNRA